MDNTLSGLNTGVTYYYRLVASSVEGEVKGAIKSFSTRHSPTGGDDGKRHEHHDHRRDVQRDRQPERVFHGSVVRVRDGYYACLDSRRRRINSRDRGQRTCRSALPQSPRLPPWSTYYFRTVARSIVDPIHISRKGRYTASRRGSITWPSGTASRPDRMTTLIIATGTRLRADPEQSPDGGERVSPSPSSNAGVSGETSADGVGRIGSILSGNPSAKYFLILYGTNDASNSAVSKATYKSNMQAIITAVKNAGKIPYLAKVPFTSDPLRSNASDTGVQRGDRRTQGLERHFSRRSRFLCVVPVPHR